MEWASISTMDITTADRSEPVLTPAVFHILLVLAAGDAHGYAIMSEVERMTGGRTQLGPGTLYRSLFRLLQAGWIVEVPGAAEPDERRRVYRLTPAGLAGTRRETLRLEALVQAARRRGLLPRRKAPRRTAVRGARA